MIERQAPGFVLFGLQSCQDLSRNHRMVARSLSRFLHGNPSGIIVGTMTRGMLNLEELRSSVESGAIDTVVVAFTDHYGRLHGKRFDATFFLDEVHAAG